MTYKKLIFSLFFLSISIFAIAQETKTSFTENTNFYLQYLENHPTKKYEDLHIILHGETNSIIELLNANGGKVKYQIPSGVNALIKAKDISLYTNSKFVNRIEFSIGQGKVLTNSSVNHSRVNFIRQALPPLNKNYTGKDVIVGIIDTGIDFTHPDFQDSLGNTRILAIWDQRLAYDSNSALAKYGYGQAWDSTDINNGNCTHVDPLSDFGHGTNVSGIAAGNGNSVNKSIADYTGYAPNAHLVVVSSNFNASNWTATVADAVDYIFHLGDSLGKPVVINASLGQLTGSHDGLDAPAQFIDSLINAKPGRAMVCAAGNFGNLPDYHLKQAVSNDSSFTWFVSNPNSVFGFNAVFYEAWADTNQFNNVQFSFGASDSATGVLLGKTSFDNINNRLNLLYTDTIFNDTGAFISQVQTYAELQGSRYLLQVLLSNPPRNYYYDLITKGAGELDIWSSGLFGYSDILKQNLPGQGTLSRLNYYQKPDSLQSIVSSWACSPSVITVGNYTNRNSFLDVDSVTQNFSVTPGALSASSSRGPSRLGVLKPDLAAPGDYTLATGLAADLNAIKAIPALRAFVGLGGYHRRVGGTSMASPAVAGVVAMMFEKCPNSNIQTIKDGLYNTIYTDTLVAASLPDFEWGRGKLDGFMALNYSNYSPQILFSDDSLLCENEVVNMSTQATYNTYQWNTGDTSAIISISQQGFFNLTVTNNNGCEGFLDSIRIDSVPNPIINLGNDTIICLENSIELNIDSNLSNVSWQNGSTAANYISQIGDSLVFVIAENQFGCSNTDSILISYFNKPQPILQNDTSICFGDSINVTPGNFQTYTWSNGKTAQSIYLKGQGLFNVVVSDSNNCHASDTIRFDSIYNLPIFNLGLDTFLCAGNNLILQGPSQMQTYSWNNGASGNSLITDSIGKYLLQVTDFNNCAFSDSLVIFHIQNLPPKVLDSAYEICQNDTLVVSGPGGNYSYLWNNGNSQQTQNFKTNGLISLMTVDSLGCFSMDSSQLTVNNLPVFSLGNDTSFCENSYSTIFLNGPQNMANYNWVVGQGGYISSFCNGPPGAICDYSLPPNGVVWLAVTDSNNCKFSDTLEIDTIPKPIISLGNDLLFCANNDSFALNIDLQPLGFNFIFWNDNDFSFQKNLTQFGEYWVEVEDQNGCVNRDTVLIDSLPVPRFNLGKDTLLPPSIKSVEFGSGIQALSYLWFNQSTDSSIILQFANDFPKQVWLQVGNGEGCFFTDSMLVDWYAWGVEESDLANEILLFPNPNNGEFNLYFKAKLNHPSIGKIYDSNGNLVYQINVSANQKNLIVKELHLSSGLYLFRLQEEETIYSKPFIVY